MPGKLTHHLGLLGRENVFIGAEMVRYHYHPFVVKDLIHSKSLEFFYRQRGSDIIRQNQINPDVYKFARAESAFARMSCQYLLS